MSSRSTNSSNALVIWLHRFCFNYAKSSRKAALRKDAPSGGFSCSFIVNSLREEGKWLSALLYMKYLPCEQFWRRRDDGSCDASIYWQNLRRCSVWYLSTVVMIGLKVVLVQEFSEGGGRGGSISDAVISLFVNPSSNLLHTQKCSFKSCEEEKRKDWKDL